MSSVFFGLPQTFGEINKNFRWDLLHVTSATWKKHLVQLSTQATSEINGDKCITSVLDTPLKMVSDFSRITRHSLFPELISASNLRTRFTCSPYFSKDMKLYCCWFSLHWWEVQYTVAKVKLVKYFILLALIQSVYQQLDIILYHSGMIRSANSFYLLFPQGRYVLTVVSPASE